MKLHKSLLGLMIALGLFAAPAAAEGEQVLGGSFEESWTAALDALSDLGLSVLVADQREGTIRTDRAVSSSESVPPDARFRYSPPSRAGIVLRFQRFSDHGTGVSIECEDSESGMETACDEELIEALKERISVTAPQRASIAVR